MSEVIGFDFGTTNSLISFVTNGEIRNVLDNKLPHPSVVAYQGESVIAGRKAKNLLAASGIGVMGNIVVSPKSLLGREKVFIEGLPRSPLDIVADLVRHIQGHARVVYPEQSFDRAVVTIPVGMDGQRRRALRDAFRMAGIRIRQFVHEPFAALYAHLRDLGDTDARLRDLDGQLIVVFDWGGGTLDLTLCQLQGRTLFQIRNLGIDSVGGDHMDDLIREQVVRRALAMRGPGGDVNYQPGARQALRAAAERAKIELSGSETSLIYVSDAFDIPGGDPDLEYRLSRVELEEICADSVAKGVRQIDQVLEAARIEPASVALCLATGGMANMPLIQARLLEYFGPARLHVSRRGGTIISEGAAWIAEDGEPLRLAKNIELSLARNTYLPLLKANTRMPQEDEVLEHSVGLYSSDPRDGHAKFEFVSPLVVGKPVAADHRIPLDVMTIDVHKDAEPFRERLLLEFTLDQDLIFRAEARSTLKRNFDQIELHELEFGMSIASSKKPSVSGEEPEPEPVRIPVEPPVTPTGSLMLRSNLASRPDDFMVPGELLHRWKPFNFADRPNIQRDEYLYYRPCGGCGRRIDDKNCRCISGPSPW